MSKNELFALLSASLLVGILLYLDQPISAAKINGPFVTRFVNDVSGSDVFKSTVGLTNISKTNGPLNVCVTPSEAVDKEVCQIFDAAKEFSSDFGNVTCTTCIVTIGTFVFPAENVPANSKIQACALKLDGRSISCNHTFNSAKYIPEDIVIELGNYR